METKKENSSLISVIVPVFRVEKYLPECIESILKQSYPNLEIVLVDDGSPDHSGAICDEFARRIAASRLFISKTVGLLLLVLPVSEFQAETWFVLWIRMTCCLKMQLRRCIRQ